MDRYQNMRARSSSPHFPVVLHVWLRGRAHSHPALDCWVLIVVLTVQYLPTSPSANCSSKRVYVRFKSPKFSIRYWTRVVGRLCYGRSKGYCRSKFTYMCPFRYLSVYLNFFESVCSSILNNTYVKTVISFLVTTY